MGSDGRPAAAVSYPKVSRDGKTYVFRVAPGLRMSSGERITAANFAHEIDRVLQAGGQSYAGVYVQDVVGAQAVAAGTASHASGVVARGNTLTVHLTDSARDFPARMSVTAFCAVPKALPMRPEVGLAPYPGSGPFYIDAYVPGRKLVLSKNRFYKGTSPRHVDQFSVSFVDSDESALADVEAGHADYADTAGDSSSYVPLMSKYRLNRSQLYRIGGQGVRFLAFNCAGLLFKNNPRLRQAINFAIDRSALLRERGPGTGTPTDHYLPSSMPGFRIAAIYPLRHPDLKKARALAAGHLRSRHAVLWAQNSGPSVTQAQLVQAELKRIGLTVTVKLFPGPKLFQLLFRPRGAPYDMTFVGYGPDYLDPAAMLNVLLDGRQIGKPTSYDFARFNSAAFNAALSRADRLTGAARFRAYGRLDVEIARTEAPLAAYSNDAVFNFVSERVGCLRFAPYLDLAAVCLK
jgi:ABC-type transport system substrate-binding protein